MNNKVDKILAIVVVYNKAIAKSETINSLGQDLLNEGLLMDLFVYDNSSFKQIETSPNGFNLKFHYHSGANVGVSAAYNEGVRFAQSIGKDWVLLLDQDTFFEQGAVREYLVNVNDNPDVNLFAPIIKLDNGTIFSPFKIIFKRGFGLKKIQPNKYLLKGFSPVNSGILVRISSFIEVKGYNERVKLDFSDIEFTRRFASFNKEFKVINTTCIQDFSNNETDVNALNTRFVFFCQGIKNCYRNNFFHDLQFFIIVIIRLSMLIAKTRRFIFIKTFYNTYIK